MSCDAGHVLDSVVTPPADATAEDAAPGGSFVYWFVLALVMFGIGVALTLVRIPYLVLEPGSTFETEEFVQVEGAESFESPDGEVRFVTVTQRRLSPVGWLISRFRESDMIFHEDELLRGRTFDEQREENAQLMLTSQSNSIAAALTQLGFEVSEPAGVVVIDVIEGGALDGVVSRNDVITAVDGATFTTVQELFDALEPRAPGEEVTLLVNPPGEAPIEVPVTLTGDTAAFLGVARGADVVDAGDGAVIEDVVPGGPVAELLGPGDRITEVDGVAITNFEDLVLMLSERRSGELVQLSAVQPDGTAVEGEVELGSRALERAGLLNAATQFRDAALPFDVEILTEDVGGPSAGLAFTITVLDVLTEGDLTGGNQIVVTGTMNRDGSVGAIGGVHQKAFAARDADAAVFLVPSANLDEARAAVDDLRIEPVDTLADALAIIGELGGNVDELPTDGQL